MKLTISDFLSRIPDPRIGNRLEHSLCSLLKLILLGKLCGRVTVKSAWRMAKRLESETLIRLGFPAGKAPCYTTLTETLKRVDANDVRLVFATAVRGVGVGVEEVIAVDGKALRGSANDEHLAVKLLAALSTRLQGVIGEVPVPEGSNEITAMLDLLDRVDLAGMILTGDAAFAQKNICDKVNEKKADFVFTVKENQPTLHARIEAATGAAAAALSPSGTPHHRRCEPV